MGVTFCLFGFNYIKVSLDWLKKYFIKKTNFNYDKLNVCTKLFSLGLDQSKILLQLTQQSSGRQKDHLLRACCLMHTCPFNLGLALTTTEKFQGVMHARNSHLGSILLKLCGQNNFLYVVPLLHYMKVMLFDLFTYKTTI